MRRRPLWRALVVLALLLCAGIAGAQPARPWYEEYEAGLLALRAKRAGDAIGAFERAAQLRPEPGRNVQSYGTNFVEDYQPYLRLAEACLLVEDVAAARLALERGERHAGESVAGRARVRQQIEAIEARKRAAAAPPATPEPRPSAAPPPTSTPTPAPPAPPPTLAPADAIPPSPTPTPERARPAVSPHPTPPSRATALPPSSTPSASSSPVPAPALLLRTTPPGAHVYLDEALIGTTDPSSGRLRIHGVAPGVHRLRVARPGYADQVRSVEAVAGDAPALEITLLPQAAAVSTPEGSFERALTWPARIAILVVGLLLLLALRRRRSGGGDGSLTWTFALSGTPPGRTPSGRTPAVSDRTPGGSPRTPRPFEADEVFPIPFGDYSLLARLGRGGMAIVYDAERDGERVALKRPLPGFQDDPRFLERFLREAEIGRTLYHPNVIRILDRGEVDGVPFFTMERIEGETLAARLRRQGALPEAEARRVLLAVAEALDYGHSKGVVHRDLKPSNVLLGADGTIKVTDYGIARARRFEGMTATGAFLGSPDYAAPEMIEGHPLDARADLYALGVIAYEMLAGRRPFEADAPFAVLRLHVSEPPRPLRELAPQVSPALEAEVMRLLAKDPAQRQADAEELLLRLQGMGTGG
ncbi:MAG: protein kinase [Vicinamibacteria bacterium]|nr:protein kinase [Vicinamibacteria bacterium]